MFLTPWSAEKIYVSAKNILCALPCAFSSLLLRLFCTFCDTHSVWILFMWNIFCNANGGAVLTCFLVFYLCSRKSAKIVRKLYSIGEIHCEENIISVVRIQCEWFTSNYEKKYNARRFEIKFCYWNALVRYTW